MPEYDLKEKLMRSLICMFDSGFTLPQGREVINYYYPLQYGFDGLIEICKQRKARWQAKRMATGSPAWIACITTMR